MKPIILKNKDAATIEALTAEIRAAEGRAKVRTITAENIFCALAGIEKKFGIPKKYMDGIEVDVDWNAQDFPAAYNGLPESTRFSAIYKRGTWRVTEIYRYYTRRASQTVKVYTMPEAAKETLVARYSTFSRSEF